MEYLVTAGAVLLAWICARFGIYFLSGLVLIASGILLYRIFYKRSGTLLDPAALFSIAWIGGAGVSAMKFSRLQTDWELLTWICIAAAWFTFALGCRLAERHEKKRIKRSKEKSAPAADRTAADVSISCACSRTAERIFKSILILTAVSSACFLFEAWRLGYVPLFIRDTPHAYSYFHVSGVHYFTVSCVLVPSCMVLYIENLKCRISYLHETNAALSGKRLFQKLWMLGYGGHMTGAILCTGISLLIPILCVSRFQLIFSVLLAIFTKAALMGKQKVGKRMLRACILFFACMLPVYIGLTAARAHDVAYLNGIFEMKDPRTPIFFTQPYMYIANNFDNLNCLIRDLPEGGHTLGLRMLFPLWALSGFKFLFPGLVSFPLYVTKTELTTVTLFYDAYYDFGVLGILIFGLILGVVCRTVFDAVCSDMDAVQTVGKMKRQNACGKKAALILIYAQLAFYLLFSFFTTWFSNPATWFYLALSVLFYFYLAEGKGEKKN